MARPARKPKRAKKSKSPARVSKPPKKAPARPKKASPRAKTPKPKHKSPTRQAAPRPRSRPKPKAAKRTQRTGHKKPGPKRPPVRELKKLARRPWRELSERQKHALRSWRAKRGAKTKRDEHYTELVDRLNSTDRRVRVKVRAELRREGTRNIARYLHDLGWDDDDITDVIAYWFYSS